MSPPKSCLIVSLRDIGGVLLSVSTSLARPAGAPRLDAAVDRLREGPRGVDA